MHSLGLNLEGNEVKDNEIDNISNSISNSITGSPSSKYGVYIQRENCLQYNPQNGHKSAHGPHGRDVTHILCKVTGLFLLKSFHFRRLQKRKVFPHTNPYISDVTQQCRCSPMLIFRAWATCDLIALTAKKWCGY